MSTVSYRQEEELRGGGWGRDPQAINKMATEPQSRGLKTRTRTQTNQLFSETVTFWILVFISLERLPIYFEVPTCSQSKTMGKWLLSEAFALGSRGWVNGLKKPQPDVRDTFDLLSNFPSVIL